MFLQPFFGSWSFWLLVVLFIAETSHAVIYQIPICSIQLAGTILLMTSVKYNVMDGDSTPLVYRVGGTVSFMAIIFTTLTHGIEMITEMFYSNPQEEHHHGHDESGSLPNAYYLIGGVDLVLKTLLILLRKVPSFQLSRTVQLAFFLLPSITILLLVYLSQRAHFEESWWWEHMTPVSTILLALLSGVLIWPSFRELRPYIFAESPSTFDASFFKRDIYSRFPDVRCSHVHVYRVWPKSASEALVHLNIKIDKDESEWWKPAQKTYERVAAFVRENLKSNSGTLNVCIEPRFVSNEEFSSKWTACCERRCQLREKTCCSEKQKHNEKGKC